MANGSVLGLATLPARHPRIGEALLKQFGAQVIVRLSIDPVRLPAGTLQREVKVDRNTPATGRRQVEEVHEIGWGGLPEFSENYCARLRWTINEQQITEDAAVGVMALLVHELEKMTLWEVLPIGSGGDDWVRRGPTGTRLQVEVSGIREDTAGGQAAARLAEKCNQVLRHSSGGYVCVTTFRRRADGAAHSYLHYVQKKSKKSKGKKRS